MVAKNVRLLSSQGLMPPNTAIPVFEELLTLPVNKFTLKELVSQIGDSDGKKQSKNELRDCCAMVLLFIQQFADDLPEKFLECKKFIGEFDRESADIDSVIFEFENVKKDMWSLFQLVPHDFSAGFSKYPSLKECFNQTGDITDFEKTLGDIKKLTILHNKVIETEGWLKGEYFNPPVNLSMSEGNYKVESGKLIDFIELSVIFKRKAEILTDKIDSLSSKKEAMDKMKKQFNKELEESTSKVITKLKVNFEDKYIYHLGLEAVKLVYKALA